MEDFRSKLMKALALTLLPPAMVAGLYLYGRSTGCNGGDCAGPMMAVLFAAIAAVPYTLRGIFTLLRLLIRAAAQLEAHRARPPVE